jgi:GMP reductase
MSSDLANKKHFGGLKDYRTSEGRVVKKPYQGSVTNVVHDILGGLRSACSYTNSFNLFDLRLAKYNKCNNTHNKNSVRYEVK